MRGPTERMPVLFVGQGSPMNAIEDNTSSTKWREVARARKADSGQTGRCS
jgi:aromatic ring-opening dioxygenase catalytic subunit (LigB family)